MAKILESKLSVIILLFATVLQYADVLGCMVERSVGVTFEANGTCYWTIPATDFSTWNSAKVACEDNDGTLATIASEEENIYIANRIPRPAYIGLYMENDNTWLWVGGSYTEYQQDISGDQVTTNNLVLNTDGSWQMVQIDPEDLTDYEALCVKDYELLKCDDLSIANGNIKTGVFPAYIGDSVTLECNPGYRWNTFDDTEQTAVCVSGPKWSANVYDCFSDSRCPNPPVVANTTMTKDSTTNQTEISYECLDGWRFADGNYTKSIVCDGVNWGPEYDLDTLQCEERVCDILPLQGANSYHAEIGMRVGYRMVYYCQPGFILASRRYTTVSTCQDNGGREPSWSSVTIPDCEPVQCLQPRVDRVLIQGEFSWLSEVGQSLVYECDGNLQFPGGGVTKQITCKQDGEWDDSPPRSGCEESYCQTGWLRSIGSCYLPSDSQSLGLRYNAAMRSCELKLSYLATVNDFDEKNIVFRAFYDSYGRDVWIGYHKVNGTWQWHDDSDTLYNNFASGYPELYDCARSSVNGIWKDRDCNDLMPYICEKSALCGMPPTIDNADLYPPGQIQTVPVEIGTAVYYKCKSSFSLDNGATFFSSTCVHGGAWSWTGNCLRTVCPTINSPNMTVNNSYVDKDRNYLGDKVRYTCQDGYIFPDGDKFKVIQCMINREWGYVPPPCEVLRCPSPAMPNATALLGVDEFGAADTVTCDNGYAFPDGRTQNVLTCAASGEWEPKDDRCLAVRCQDYYIPHATVSASNVRYPQSVTVKCDKGYKVASTQNKTKIMTCSASGSWIGDPATCQPVYCPGQLPPFANNTIRSTNSVQGGTTVIYRCKDGYILAADGSYSRTAWCAEESLEWQGVPARGCVDFEVYIMDNLFVHPDTLAVMALTWACIACGALFSLLGLLWLLTVLADWNYVTNEVLISEDDRPWTVIQPVQVHTITKVEEFNAKFFEEYDDMDMDSELDDIKSVGGEREVYTPDTLDRISIGTTYYDRFTPDLRYGLDDCSLGERTPTPEPTTPVATKREKEVKQAIKQSVLRLKEMKEHYAAMPSRVGLMVQKPVKSDEASTPAEKPHAKPTPATKIARAKKKILSRLNSKKTMAPLEEDSSKIKPQKKRQMSTLNLDQAPNDHTTDVESYPPTQSQKQASEPGQGKEDEALPAPKQDGGIEGEGDDISDPTGNAAIPEIEPPRDPKMSPDIKPGEPEEPKAMANSDGQESGEQLNEVIDDILSDACDV